MKFVKILINNIFIPFATFLFILVGVFAALLSAIIEFAVLKELFTSEYQEFIPSFLIALALVLLLEYSKLYLHYLLGRWKHKPDSNSAKYMKKVRIIVSIPIAISFVCTVIFSVTTLDKASYNENAFQTEKARIENQLKTDIQDGKAALDADVLNLIARQWRQQTLKLLILTAVIQVTKSRKINLMHYLLKLNPPLRISTQWKVLSPLNIATKKLNLKTNIVPMLKQKLPHSQTMPTPPMQLHMIIKCFHIF